jgi:protein-L-isoaspartate(D-aspartate) O-methyltransferase
MKTNENLDPTEPLRRRMVESQLIRRGISDPRVLDAFRRVPRHEFVGGSDPEEAYGDFPVSIGKGQTISQPYMVALMTETLGLKGGERVLEIGSGSGYQAAILSLLVGKVWSVERIPELAAAAREKLKELEYDNVEVVVADGTKGWPERAPYQGIVVTAGAPDVPPPLVEQLEDGGRLVIPVGGSYSQELVVVEKRGGKIYRRDEGGCVFVPLIGEYGWKG